MTKWNFIKVELNEKVQRISRQIIEMQEFFWAHPDLKELIDKRLIDDLKGTGVEL